jgi:putative FmdB family regulatory protein
MPTYEYKCEGCGHEFEAFQSISEDPIKICPSCGEVKVKRLISAGAGLIFKGSGFYITDYKKKESSSKVGTEREKKSETKPEKKETKSSDKKDTQT